MSKQFHLLPSALITRQPGEEDWAAMSNHLMRTHHSINWWIGDFFSVGQKQLGEDFYQYVDPYFSQSLIERCVRVAESFPPGERFEKLSWSHHQGVMTLSKPMRKAVLTLAQKQNWNTYETKEYVKGLENG